MNNNNKNITNSASKNSFIVKDDMNININHLNSLTETLKHNHISDDISPSTTILPPPTTSIHLSHSPNSLIVGPETQSPLYNSTLNKYNVNLTPTSNHTTTTTTTTNNNNNPLSNLIFPGTNTTTSNKHNNNKPPILFENLSLENNTPFISNIYNSSTHTLNKTPDTNSTPFKPTDKTKKPSTYYNSGGYIGTNTNTTTTTTSTYKNTTTTTTPSTTPSSGKSGYNYSSTSSNQSSYLPKKPSIFESKSNTTPSYASYGTPTTTTTTTNNNTTTTNSTTNNNNNNSSFKFMLQSAALNSTPSTPFTSNTVVNGNRVTDTSPQPVYTPKTTIPPPPITPTQPNPLDKIEDLLEEKLKTLDIDPSDPSYDTISEMLREEISENIKLIMDNQQAYLNNLDYYGGYEEDEYDEEDLTYERLVELEDVKVGITDEQKKHVKEYKYDRIRISQNSDCHRCTICLEDFENKQLIKELLECNHYFHSECLNPWIMDHKYCPICRREV